jgi:hypothetical protein
MVGGYQPDRVREESKYEINQPNLAITIVAMIPDRSNEAQLIESSMGSHQLENQSESMDYEGVGPMICSPPIQAAIPRIREFLQQRI